MPKKKFGVVKVFDEMPNSNDNPMCANSVEASSDQFGELKMIKQTISVKECHDIFKGILNHLQLPREDVLNCFIDGLKEDIQGMVSLFKPQTVREAYYLAKIQEQLVK